MRSVMQWDDLNKPGPYDASILGQQIHEELMLEESLPRELTQKELNELNAVERAIYRSWAVGQWLSWAPVQLTFFVLIVLSIFFMLP